MSLELSILLLVVAVILIALGGLLAAADSALMVLSRADLQTLAERSPRTGRAIEAIARDTRAHVNAVSFVRVLAETSAAVFITVTLAANIAELWLVLLIATVIMTGVTFVLVGSSPRSVGSHHPDTILRLSAPFIRGVRVVLGPIASGLIRLGDRVTPGRGVATRVRDEQQLLSIVDQAAESAVLEEDDREYIHSVLEFGDTVARSIMVPRTDMVTIDADISVRDALEVFLNSGHSRVPVMSDDVDDIEGVLYLRDVTAFMVRHPEESVGMPISTLMKPAVFVPESQKADELLRQMQLEANHLALVVDEYGGIAGLVTLEDLIEELVGEIADEYDRDGDPVEALEDGRYRVSARLPIDELGDLFERELDDEDVDTVGGLFTKLNGRLADAGDVVSIAGLRLTADRTERRRKNLVTVLVELDPDAEFWGNRDELVAGDTESDTQSAAPHEHDKQASKESDQ